MIVAHGGIKKKKKNEVNHEPADMGMDGVARSGREAAKGCGENTSVGPALELQRA